MTQFHTDDYVEFLHRINPENANNYAREQLKCKHMSSQSYSMSLILKGLRLNRQCRRR
jgi:acetoin utilization deacetylase AcuC-like enzyme